MRKKLMVVALLLALVCVVVPVAAFAQNEGAGAAAPVTTPATPQPQQGTSTSFISVVLGSGIIGIFLWLVIFAAMFACIWFIVDCAITVRPAKIMPQELVDRVTEAMAQGDVLKALNYCENEPGPMASILTAGFSHVEEGFETIQEAVGVAADLESEKLMQRISYLSVVGNLAPMLGLLGTVQGMIGAFGSLARMGSAVIGVLARDISQALYTTAFGLSIAVPAVAAYYFYRNKANRIILRMEGITLELIKDLRNVEVVEE
jgi:biopolymer transport protein ExbB